MPPAHRRIASAVIIDQLEGRTLFAGHALTVVAPLPTSSGISFAEPSELVRDSAGNLYGTDAFGGNGLGTVFEVVPSTGSATLLLSFDSSTIEKTVGVQPQALAIDTNGNLFGVTYYSIISNQGDTGPGSLFEIPATNRSTVVTLYTFSDSTVGTDPWSILADPSGNMDVLTQTGSTNNAGAILQFAPATGYAKPTTLGALPTGSMNASSLNRTAGGAFYGTTQNGGTVSKDQPLGAGTLFALPAGSSTVVTLAGFDDATTGASPNRPYVDAFGNVFGTCAGGSGDNGDVWKYSVATGKLTRLAEFTANGNQYNPTGGLVSDKSGKLIGLYSDSDPDRAGGIFTFNPTTHALAVLGTFDPYTYGAAPGLTADGAGNYYGVTARGGYKKDGFVFKLALSSPSAPTTGPTPTPTVALGSLPASVVSGSPSTGTVIVTLANSTATASTGTVTVALYATTTGAIDAASTRLAVVSKRLTLEGGRSVTVTVPVRKLSLPAGTYTVLARATEAADGGTAVSTTGPKLAVAAANVSLSSTVGVTGPTIVARGKSLSLLLTVVNAGNVVAKGRATLAIYLSVDGVAYTVPVATLVRAATVKPGGQAVTLRLKVKVPKAIAAGSFFPLVTLTQGSAMTTAAAATLVTVE